MDKVSFVIPAFNAEKTLKRVVNSIQSLDMECEIIIVENGSIDSTLSIAKELEYQHDNIFVYQSGKGVSRARNLGIEKSSGLWIIFVDADDIVLQGVKRAITDVSARPVDIYVGCYLKDALQIRHEYNKMNTVIQKGGDINDAIAWMISKPTLRMQVWAKLFRKKFLEEKNLRFNEQLAYSEDSEFLIRALYECSSIIISDLSIYKYFTSSISAMGSYKKGRIRAYLKALEESNRTIRMFNREVQSAYIQYTIAQVNIIAVHNIFAYGLCIPWRTRCRKIKALMNNSSVRSILCASKKSDYLHMSSMPVLLFAHGAYSVGGIVCYLRSIQNTIRYNHSNKG